MGLVPSVGAKGADDDAAEAEIERKGERVKPFAETDALSQYEQKSASSKNALPPPKVYSSDGEHFFYNLSDFEAHLRNEEKHKKPPRAASPPLEKLGDVPAPNYPTVSVERYPFSGIRSEPLNKKAENFARHNSLFDEIQQRKEYDKWMGDKLAEINEQYSLNREDPARKAESLPVLSFRDRFDDEEKFLNCAPREPYTRQIPALDAHEVGVQKERIETLYDIIKDAAPQWRTLQDYMHRARKLIKDAEKQLERASRKVARARTLKSIDLPKREIAFGKISADLVTLRGKLAHDEQESEKIIKYHVRPAIRELLCYGEDPSEAVLSTEQGGFVDVLNELKNSLTQKDVLLSAVKSEDVLADFLVATDTKHGVALQLLNQSDWDLEHALHTYFGQNVQALSKPGVGASPKKSESSTLARPLLTSYEPESFEAARREQGYRFRDPPVATPTRRGYTSPLLTPKFDILCCPTLTNGTPIAVQSINELREDDADFILYASSCVSKHKVCRAVLSKASPKGIEKSLTVAVLRDDATLVRLFASCFSVDQENIWGRFLLIAALKGNIGAVKECLSVVRAHEMIDKAMLAAAHKGKLAAVEMLLEHTSEAGRLKSIKALTVKRDRSKEQTLCLNYLERWSKYVYFRTIHATASEHEDQFESYFAFSTFWSNLFGATGISPEGKKFCDLKCGAGKIVFAASFGFPFSSCTGIDSDDSSIETATTTLDRYEEEEQANLVIAEDGYVEENNQNISFVQADHRRFKWSDFDVVYINLLHCAEEEVKGFEESKRTARSLFLMKENSLIVIQTCPRELSIPRLGRGNIIGWELVQRTDRLGSTVHSYVKRSARY